MTDVVVSFETFFRQRPTCLLFYVYNVNRSFFSLRLLDLTIGQMDNLDAVQDTDVVVFRETPSGNVSVVFIFTVSIGVSSASSSFVLVYE